MGRASLGKERSDWQRICKISVASVKIHAVLYMLRRCVGFSWAKPSVTKSSTHLLVFLVLNPHWQSCAAGAQALKTKKDTPSGTACRFMFISLKASRGAFQG